ncbi:signal recognition particle-docking protein FtsY [Lutibacter sp. B2]|nr:signal recognition particle-docking protein FtsY [Lutibacter sp. B2]
MLKKFFSKFKKEEEVLVDREEMPVLETETEVAKETIQEEIVVEEEKIVKDSEEDKRSEINVINEEEVEEESVQEELVEEDKEETSFFTRLKKGLSKTRMGIADKVDQVLKAYKKVDEELFEEIEEILITADAGVNTTMKIIDDLRTKAKERKITEAPELRGLLKEILIEILDNNKEPGLNVGSVPTIILVVGVNGVGKTTSIGKIAHGFKAQGKKVMLAAGDTFRAAAIDQLEIWGDRVGVDVIKHQEGADPAAVIYDAIQSAKSRQMDVLICDTAGRLHNKKNLMNELGKVTKIVEREFPEASKEILLVLDATTGQNAIQQAKVFKEVTNISGVVLTKLDGTAKGGVVLSISYDLEIPVKLIGVGEGMEDLQEFVPTDFINALFGEE